jgi:hypothetical protein
VLIGGGLRLFREGVGSHRLRLTQAGEARETLLTVYEPSR